MTCDLPKKSPRAARQRCNGGNNALSIRTPKRSSRTTKQSRHKFGSGPDLFDWADERALAARPDVRRLMRAKGLSATRAALVSGLAGIGGHHHA
jgi:hypothetical protein